MSNQPATEAALDALGHPMRRRMLEVLREGARPVGELAAALPIGRPAVSKHLRVLEGAGLVEHRSRGTRNLYAVAPAGLAQVQAWLVGLWDVRLAAFADYVAEQEDLATRPNPSSADPAGPSPRSSRND
jgi:DNA-binding transcriptional ArsR family regulator